MVKLTDEALLQFLTDNAVDGYTDMSASKIAKHFNVSKVTVYKHRRSLRNQGKIFVLGGSWGVTTHIL